MLLYIKFTMYFSIFDQWNFNWKTFQIYKVKNPIFCYVNHLQALFDHVGSLLLGTLLTYLRRNAQILSPLAEQLPTCSYRGQAQKFSAYQLKLIESFWHDHGWLTKLLLKIWREGRHFTMELLKSLGHRNSKRWRWELFTL